MWVLLDETKGEGFSQEATRDTATQQGRFHTQKVHGSFLWTEVVGTETWCEGISSQKQIPGFVLPVHT